MKIDVRGLIGLFGEQRVVDVVVPVSPVPGMSGTDFAPAAVHLTLTATPEGILAVGEVSALARLECSRCLAPFEYRAVGKLEQLFVAEAPEGTTVSDRALHAGEVDDRDTEDQLADDGFDLSPIVDGTIDIGPLVREVLELAVPMKPLCREDCRGLCPYCGKPLNEGPCGCPAEAADPRLAALGDALRASMTDSKQDLPADAEHPKDKKE